MIRDPSDGSVRENSGGDVVARANVGKQRIAAGPASTGTSEDTTQGDRPAATVKVRPPEAYASGLQTGSTKPENIARLERAREWLRKYRTDPEHTARLMGEQGE